jgi:hypothetical protein
LRFRFAVFPSGGTRVDSAAKCLFHFFTSMYQN